LFLIDFKRERINEKRFRGSLFVNQEIAIATFLKLEGLGFHEKGRLREGILDYHIYNECEFEDGTEIIEKLKKETEKWDINSVNELKIMYDTKSISKNFVISSHPQKPLSDWYHLEVKNCHKSKHALWCSGYVTEIKDLQSKRTKRIPTNELIWSGTGAIMVNIIADTIRLLDAFLVIHSENRIRFAQRPPTSTDPRYRLPTLPKGRYEIEYSVISSNFATVSRICILEYKGGTDVDFRLK